MFECKTLTSHMEGFQGNSSCSGQRTQAATSIAFWHRGSKGLCRGCLSLHFLLGSLSEVLKPEAPKYRAQTHIQKDPQDYRKMIQQ